MLRNRIQIAVCDGYDFLSSQPKCFDQRGKQCKSCGRRFDEYIWQCTGCDLETQQLQCSGSSRQCEFISTLRSQGVLDGLALRCISVEDLLKRIRASAEDTLHWCTELNKCPLRTELHTLCETTERACEEFTG